MEKYNIKLKYPLHNVRLVGYGTTDENRLITPRFTQNYLDSQIGIKLNEAKVRFDQKLKVEKKNAYESGFKSAEVKYRKEYKKKYEESLHNFNRINDNINNQLNSILEDHEQDILQLTIEIARKIIIAELDTNPEIILNILKKSMNLLSEKKQLRIFVNPADWGLIKENINNLGLQLDNPKEIEIISSPNLQPGGCRIESNAGSINADINSQLNEIANQLLIKKQ